MDTKMKFDRLTGLRNVAAIVAAVSFVLAVGLVVAADAKRAEAEDIQYDMTMFEYSTDYTSFDYQNALEAAQAAETFSSLGVSVCTLAVCVTAASHVLLMFGLDMADTVEEAVKKSKPEEPSAQPDGKRFK